MTTTTTKNAYFDLADYIQSLTCVDVAAQMAQSVAFRIDVMINGAVRVLLKNLRTNHVEHGIDTLSEMTNALEDSAFAEEIMRQAGKDDLGPVVTILQLNVIREQWQEMAKELTALTMDYRGIPRTYEIKPIDEMLLREVRLDVRPLTAQRIRVQVERRAADANKEDIEKVYAKRMAREEQRTAETAKHLTEQQGAIVTLYHLASTIGNELPHVLENSGVAASSEFHLLDVSIRHALIQASLKGAERAEDFATSSSSLTDSEFDQISFAVLKVERELKAVLNGSAYERKEEETDNA